MTFGISAIAYLAMGAAATAGVSLYNGQKQASAAKDAQAQAQKNADKAALDSDIANNRANAKSPDISSLGSKNAMDAKGGISGTLLTGAGGIDTDSLKLGKTTLLGG